MYLYLYKKKLEERIKFRSGTLVKTKVEEKYLGCKLNYKSDIHQELAKRKGEVTAIWKRLETFWKHSDCNKATKIRVYEGLIQARLLYGFSSANLTQGDQDELDYFQLKGLCQILKMDTPWGQIKQRKTHQ